MKDGTAAAHDLDQDAIDAYRRDGFCVIEDVFAPAALVALREAVDAAVEAEDTGRAPAEKDAYERLFDQKVDIRRRHPAVEAAADLARLGALAAALEGHPMRVWHDQALYKRPGLGANDTPWHQDAVYWPHRDRWRQTTIWIALEDATEANGCMSFVPGSHALGPLDPVPLEKPTDLFAKAPALREVVPQARPLRAGSATFHNGLTWHAAGANGTGRTRKAFAVIFMPEATRYTGAPHVVTDPMGLVPGAPFPDAQFPRLGS